MECLNNYACFLFSLITKFITFCKFRFKLLRQSDSILDLTRLLQEIEEIREESINSDSTRSPFQNVSSLDENPDENESSFSSVEEYITANQMKLY